MKKVVVLDAGHGGHDPGATYEGIAEKDITLSVALIAGGLLVCDGLDVVFTRISDTYVSLKERVRIANEVNAACFVSIHTNADPDPDLPGMPVGRGEEIFVASLGVRGYELAQHIAYFIDNVVPGAFRGIKPAPFYVLKHTKMPAALVEIGFIDNPESRLYECSARIRAAQAIARGISVFV